MANPNVAVSSTRGPWHSHESEFSGFYLGRLDELYTLLSASARQVPVSSRLASALPNTSEKCGSWSRSIRNGSPPAIYEDSLPTYISGCSTVAIIPATNGRIPMLAISAPISDYAREPGNSRAVAGRLLLDPLLRQVTPFASICILSTSASMRMYNGRQSRSWGPPGKLGKDYLSPPTQDVLATLRECRDQALVPPRRRSGRT